MAQFESGPDYLARRFAGDFVRRDIGKRESAMTWRKCYLRESGIQRMGKAEEMRRRSRKGYWRSKAGLVVLGAAVLLSSCGSTASASSSSTKAKTSAGKPVFGGTINVAVPSDPPTLDWTSSTSTITYEVAWNIFEQLFALDKNSVPRPMLATGYNESANGLKYTIGIRKGVTFQNGQPLTSADVVASIKRWEAVSSVGATVATHIANVSATGSYRVVINMSTPFSPLIVDLAAPAQACIIIPASIAAAAGVNPLSNAQIIGTGPYKLTSDVVGQEIVLTRWNGYRSLPKSDNWGGLAGYKAAYPTHLVYQIVPSPATRISGLLTKQFQLADTLTSQDYSQLTGNPAIKPLLLPPTTQLMAVFNKMESPFNNLKMREAINLVANKPDIAASAFGSKQFWTLSNAMFLPSQTALYTTAGYKQYSSYNPSEAKKLIQQSGYNLSRPIRILVTQTYPYMYSAGVALSEELNQIGVKTSVLTYDWPTDLALRKNPSAWDIFITGFSPLFDPTQVLWISPTYNGWYNSPQMQSLLNQWSASTTKSQQSKLMTQIQSLEWTQLPIVKIADEKTLSGESSNLHGYQTIAGDDILWNAWLS